MLSEGAFSRVCTRKTSTFIPFNYRFRDLCYRLLGAKRHPGTVPVTPGNELDRSWPLLLLVLETESVFVRD